MPHTAYAPSKNLVGNRKRYFGLSHKIWTIEEGGWNKRAIKEMQNDK